MKPELVVALMSVAVSVIAVLYSVLRDRGGDSTALEHRLTALETKLERAERITESSEHRMSTVETKVEVFWRNVGYDAARILHSPDPALARQDYLLERFMDDTISGVEVMELIKKMHAIYEEHDAQPGQRLAAATILRAIEHRPNVAPGIAAGR